MFGVNSALPVGVASVSHNADVDEAGIVVDRGDDPVVADADSPEIGSSLQLDTPVRPWIGGKASTRAMIRRQNGLKPFEFPPS
jgi:predicted secreted protein